MLEIGAFITLAIWYAVPWLKKRSRVDALIALLLK
jgi:hypothetical protein